MQFDLRSSQGVIQALQAVRNSSLDAAKQNELRDLIFLYANNGGDPELLNELNTKLVDLPAAAAAPSDAPQPPAETAPDTTSAAPAQQPKADVPYPTGRPTPVFNTPEPSGSNTPQPTPAAEPATPTPPPAADISTEAEPMAANQQPEAASTPSPEPQAPVTTPPMPEPSAAPPTPEPAATPEPPSAQPAVSEPEPPPAQAAPAAQTADQPEPVAPPTPAQPTPSAQQPASAAPETPTQSPTAAPAAPPSGDRDTALNRIREIKREMNALVGNPVNIIEINNEVGREYMAALLDAMKKVNGGAPGELDGAMQRLEAAYTSAQKVVTQNESGASQPQPTSEAPAPEPTPEPNTATSIPVKSEPEPPAAPAPTAPTTPAPAAKPPTPPAPQPPQPEPAPPSAPAPAQQPAATAPAPVSNQRTQPAAAAEQSYEPLPQQVGYASAGQPAPAAQQQSADTRTRVQELTANLNAQRPNQPAPMNAPAGNQGAGNISAVTPATHEFSTEPEPMSGGQSVDPNGEQVTEGLKQLLSEWSLFKSSGLFGTGPNGIDHPLYKKLANLPITNILANRYEDAKPETKQSITDYMNGWRYEQGITYEPGETFEQYLRRVITKIIENQQRTGA